MTQPAFNMYLQIHTYFDGIYLLILPLKYQISVLVALNKISTKFFLKYSKGKKNMTLNI